MLSPQPVGSLEHLTSRSLFAPVGVPVHVNLPIHDGDVPLHDHDFFEIAVVIGGVGVHRTIHGEAAIAAGDVFILHPGQWHAYERTRQLKLCNCLLGIELLTHEIGWTRTDPLLGPLLPNRLAGPDRVTLNAGQGVMSLHLEAPALADLMRELDVLRQTLLQGDPVQARAEVIGRVLLVLTQLSRAYAANPATRAERSREADSNVVAAIEAMAERLDHDWGLVELAKRLQLNRSYLVRLFKRHTGQSPMAWLARQRAEKAAVLLLTTDKAIAAIGREVGWHDPNYFARRFRAAFGISARQYRNQLPCPALVKTADAWIQW
ncbi:MAG: AraC family transcriptional regulator [Planctomycetes bacterium]|nr:AraC family transcriptional regulator [Planctomycetota bacterium]